MKAVQELQNTYLQGANTGDLDLFMSVWAEDAIRLEEGINYIVGKANIRKHFSSAFEQFQINITIYGEIERKMDGNLAYSHGNFLLSLTPKGTDSTFHVDYKFLEVYEKQDDGTWKIAVGSTMTNPQWTNESLSPDLLKKEDNSAPKL